MKITGFDIFTFNLPVRQAGLPLAQPFVVKGRPISKREGLIIRLTTEDGNVGFGEISPLPGFSKESLKEAQGQLVDLRLKSTLFPSVQFGLETAILNLLRDEKKRAPVQQNIPLIGLLQGSIKEIVPEIRRMLRQGFRNFKLKVGTKDISKDIEKVQRIQDVLKKRATLRLDANQLWTFDEAIRFAKAIPKDSIEYIEEPFKNSSWAKFFKETGIPIALDESLLKMNPKNFKPVKGIKAFILKPTLLGGVEKTYQWIQRAKALRIQAVISSSFESGVGLSMLAQLAANTDGPAGLDTYKYFSKDVLKTPLKIKKGRLIFNSALVSLRGALFATKQSYKIASPSKERGSQ